MLQFTGTTPVPTMAFDPFYVNSLDNPGAVFRITFYKPAGQPARVTASEGVIETSTGHSMFRCYPLSCRQFQTHLPSRATKKAIAAALSALLDGMKSQNVIAADSQAPAV